MGCLLCGSDLLGPCFGLSFRPPSAASLPLTHCCPRSSSRSQRAPCPPWGLHTCPLGGCMGASAAELLCEGMQTGPVVVAASWLPEEGLLSTLSQWLRREGPHASGLAAVQQCGWGRAAPCWPRLPNYTASRFSQLCAWKRP